MKGLKNLLFAGAISILSLIGSESCKKSTAPEPENISDTSFVSTRLSFYNCDSQIYEVYLDGKVVGVIPKNTFPNPECPNCPFSSYFTMSDTLTSSLSVKYHVLDIRKNGTILDTRELWRGHSPPNTYWDYCISGEKILPK